MLRRESTPTHAALGVLSQREAELGFTLPAAVRAWYAIEGASELLRRGLDGQGIPIEELGAPYAGLSDEPIDLVREGRLLLLVENQGVCSWAVRLDGSDDPPVDIEYDSMPEPEWHPFAHSFSAFVEHCAFWTERVEHPLSVMGLADTSSFARALAELEDTIGGAWSVSLETLEGLVQHGITADGLVSYVEHERCWVGSARTSDGLQALLGVMLAHVPADRVTPRNDASKLALTAAVRARAPSE
jgi:hypothetical protein